MKPTFTVAIPTRDRADTLRAALRTCVTQDFDSVEFVVSDNNSQDRTREVVEELDDPRIRYVNTSRRLSMSENFEFALSHARGDLVTFIGDDDGLLPRALTDLRAEVDLEATPAVVWPAQHYYWPGFFEPELANTLSIDLKQPPGTRQVRADEMLTRVARFRTRYTRLPSPYFGVVRRDVLHRASSATSGRFFNSITPDVYAGVAVASVIDAYAFSSKAYSLSGQSRHSNGSSQVTGKGESDTRSETAKFLQENTVPFHQDLAYAPSIPILVAEAFLQVRDHVHSVRDVRIELPDVIHAALRDPNFLFNIGIRETVLAALQAIAERHGLQEVLAAELRAGRSRRYVRAVVEAGRLITLEHPLIDCEEHAVTDVYAASLLHHRLIEENARPAARLATTARARVSKTRRVAASGWERLRTERAESGAKP